MPAGTLVSTGSLVSPGGQQGIPGVQGIPGPAGAVGQTGDAQPVGTVFAFGSTTPPSGCLLADGSTISRTTYAALFAIFGTTFGSGDGATTFGLPDLRSRMVLGQGLGIGLSNRTLAATGGEETHALTTGELAVHAHGVSDPTHLHNHDHYHNYNASQLNHAHGISDPAHAHIYTYKNLETAGTGGQSGTSFANVSQATWTDSRGTGIGIQTVGFGWTNTEWASQASSAWVNTATSSTGISIQNAGSGTAHNNMPPFVVLTYMVKAAVVGAVSPSAPLADTTQPGMLCKVSGLATDYVGGDNAVHDLATAVRTYAPVIRSYNSLGNPNFEIDARTVAAGVSGSGFPLDRWQYAKNGTNAGSVIQNNAPSGVIIAGTNFCVSSKFLRYTLTTQQATLGASDYIRILEMVEGSRLRELIGGQTAISIVCRSSVANTKFSCTLRDPAASYSLQKLCTLTNANAWTLISIPNIATWAAGATFPITPGVQGYFFEIVLAAGSTFMSSANDIWNSANFLGAAGQGNFAANPVGSTFDIAYIGHEPGPTPNGVIDKDFQTNLQECKRYFCKSYDYGTPAGTNTSVGLSIAMPVASNAFAYPNDRFEVEMAKTPTITLYGSGGTLNTIDQAYVAWMTANGYTAFPRGIAQVNFTTNFPAANWNPVHFHYLADTGW